MRESIKICTSYLTKIESIRMSFGVPLRLVGVINLMLIWSCKLNVQGREPYLYDFVKQNFNIGLHSDIYRPVSFKLSMMVETTKLYILIYVWLTMTFIQGHDCTRNQKLWCPFSKLSINLDEIQCFATTCWLVEAHAWLIMHKSYARERTLHTWFYEIYVWRRHISGDL